MVTMSFDVCYTAVPLTIRQTGLAYRNLQLPFLMLEDLV